MDISNLSKNYSREKLIRARNFKKVRIPNKLDKDLAYFVGFLRDGMLTARPGAKGDYRIEIYQKNATFLRTIIKPLIKKLFDVDVNISFQYKELGTVARVRIYSKQVYMFIKDVFEHPDTNGQKTCRKIPDIILNAKPNIQKAYIRGFFDAEGCISKTLDAIRIGQAWDKKSKSPMHDIQKMLDDIDIRSSVLVKFDKRPNRKPIYVLSITNRPGIFSFITKIGANHPDKLKRFNKFCDLFAPE